MRRLLVGVGAPVVCLGLVLAAACGGGQTLGQNDAGPGGTPPRLIGGGGAGDGPLAGVLHVYVIDAWSRAPITAAHVRVDPPDGTAPLEGAVDAAGLVSFADSRLHGPVRVSATAAAFAAATWIGVDAANLTIPLEDNQGRVITPVKVTGTIEGWDTRPAPADGHLVLAYVNSSHLEPLDAADNRVTQEKMTVAGLTLPTNVCYALTLGTTTQSKCLWQLLTRTGKQALWAVVVDIDTKKTVDTADDTTTIVDYAFLLGLDAVLAHTYTSQVLVPVGPASLVDASVAFAAAPAGLTQVTAQPTIRLGDAGVIVLANAIYGPSSTTRKLPPLAGVLAGGEYEFVAHAQAAADAAYPQSTIWKHGASLAAPVGFGTWQAPPAALAAAAGSYSFGPVAGATLHTVQLFGEAGHGPAPLWNVTLLDGSQSFTLPALAPSPLPGGSIQMGVGALTLPDGFDPTSFTLDAIRAAALSSSAAVATVTPQ
jgi:hypothetical protein